jgi:hypothetical protein
MTAKEICELTKGRDECACCDVESVCHPEDLGKVVWRRQSWFSPRWKELEGQQNILKSDAMNDREAATIVVFSASRTLGKKSPIIIHHLYIRASFFTFTISCWFSGISVADPSSVHPSRSFCAPTPVLLVFPPDPSPLGSVIVGGSLLSLSFSTISLQARGIPGGLGTPFSFNRLFGAGSISSIPNSIKHKSWRKQGRNRGS